MNVLLIGGGWIAETVYVPFLSEMSQIETIYIQDLDIDLVKTRFSAFDKVKAVSAEDRANLNCQHIFILTPSFAHAEELQNALRDDAVILVEKPICTSLMQAKMLEEVASKSNARVFVSAPFRHRCDMQELKKVILSGELGDIYHVEMAWMKRRGTPGSAWFTQKKYSGGGVLADMGPHLLDLFYWLFGSRKAKNYLAATSSLFLESGDAYANWHAKKEHSTAPDVEDNCFALLTYDDLSLALNIAWASDIENDYALIRVFGSKGVLEVVTSIGFSTNTLYKETTFSLSHAAKPQVKTMEIEDRKEPFRKLLHQLIEGQIVNLPRAEEALVVARDIFRLYDSSQAVKGGGHA